MTTPPRNPPVETVRIDDVSMAYGTRLALSDVSFTLRGGESTSLIGPNGSGKSTLLNAIAGLHRPTSGSVTVLGERPDAVRARIAYVL